MREASDTIPSRSAGFKTSSFFVNVQFEYRALGWLNDDLQAFSGICRPIWYGAICMAANQMTGDFMRHSRGIARKDRGMSRRYQRLFCGFLCPSNTQDKFAKPAKTFFMRCLILLAFLAPNISTALEYRGVNLSVAEFGQQNLPGTFGTDYRYPTVEELDYFTSKGMNTFRLPFRWERLQREQFANLFTEELARIHTFVDEATLRGAKVILDPHNFSRYYGLLVGGATVPTSAFSDFWEKLANEFKSNPDVIFGLVNEPSNMPTELWLQNANSAIAAIRQTGANNLILVPGNGWSGAHSWYLDYYGTPNSIVMLGVVDPLDNFAIEVHQYLDQDSSGTSSTCISDTIGSERLMAFTQWLIDNNLKGFLGELGGGSNQTCLNAITDMLSYLQEHNDVWQGWAYWAAGPWWGNYFTSIEPAADGSDKPQMDILEPFLQRCNGEYVTVNMGLGHTTTPGDDVVIGTSGVDVIRGKAGNDTICGMEGDDFIHGNAGDDWVDGGDGVDNLRGGQGDDIIYTGSGATVGYPELAFGGEGNDLLYGGPDADRLSGGGGVDVIRGGDGDDEIAGNDDDDFLRGQKGNDTISGGLGDDKLFGNSGDDTLNGGSGEFDECDGGNGNGDSADTGCETMLNIP